MTELDDSVIAEAIAHLSDADNAEPAEGFPTDARGAERPGLYAWWADPEALATLSEPFGVRLPPLIYAGEAGATSSRAKLSRTATLRSRVRANHLNGNVASSTFRETISAILLDPLSLDLSGPRRLAPDSNRVVSAWMRHHLRIAVFPVDDRHFLARVETAVLAVLDPPLNLMGMPPSTIRTRLRELRAALKEPQVGRDQCDYPGH